MILWGVSARLVVGTCSFLCLYLLCLCRSVGAVTPMGCGGCVYCWTDRSSNGHAVQEGDHMVA